MHFKKNKKLPELSVHMAKYTWNDLTLIAENWQHLPKLHILWYISMYIYVDKSIDLTSFFNSSLVYTKTLCFIVHVHLYVYSIWCVCTIYFITIGFELRFLKVFISYLNFGYLICNYFVTIWYICYWLLNSCLGW